MLSLGGPTLKKHKTLYTNIIIERKQILTSSSNPAIDCIDLLTYGKRVSGCVQWLNAKLTIFNKVEVIFVWQISYPPVSGASLGCYFCVQNLTSA